MVKRENTLPKLQSARLALRDLCPPGCIPDCVTTSDDMPIRALAAATKRLPQEKWRLPDNPTDQDRQDLLEALARVDRKDWMRAVNCYSFAVNCLSPDPPGHLSAYNPGQWSLGKNAEDVLTAKGLLANCQHDGLILIDGLTPPSENLRGHYLVAAYIGVPQSRQFDPASSVGLDFHFLRREASGVWIELSTLLRSVGITQILPVKFDALLERETGFNSCGATFTDYHLVGLLWCPNAGLPLGNAPFLARNPKFGQTPDEPLTEYVTLPPRPISTSTEKK